MHVRIATLPEFLMQLGDVADGHLEVVEPRHRAEARSCLLLMAAMSV